MPSKFRYSSGRVPMYPRRTPIGKTILRAAACLVWVGGVVLAIVTSLCTETVGSVSRTAFSWLNFHTALCAYALYGGLLWIASALFERPGTLKRALSSLRALFPGSRDSAYTPDPDEDIPCDAPNFRASAPRFDDSEPNDFDAPDPDENIPHDAPTFRASAPHFDGSKPNDFDAPNPDENIAHDAPTFRASAPHFDDSEPEDYDPPHLNDLPNDFDAHAPGENIARDAHGFRASAPHFDDSEPQDYDPFHLNDLPNDFDAPNPDEDTPAASPASDASPSDEDEDEPLPTVLFGHWPKADGEPIAWNILLEEEDRKLLLCQTPLANMPYHDADEPTSWEACSLRAWLNDDFYRAAFSDSEKQKILKIPVSADKNTYCNTDAGSSTDDRVFLMSLPEVQTLLRRRLSPLRKWNTAPSAAPHTDNQAANDAGCIWWLRSPGSERTDAACVNGNGEISNLGLPVTTPTIAARPCLWVRGV